MNEGSFFQDLAMLMAAAGVAAALFTRLRWPKVFGYILAGILLSRHTWGGSLLADETSVQTIGQLGIVFLMFSMGLEFSTSEMKKLRSVAIPAALIDTLVMTALGYSVGRNVFGWGSVPSLFLGVAICDSATTLLVKIIGELGWSNRPFVKYVVGTSVCEDILCVGAIAVVTGVANGRGLSLGAAALSLGGLGVFFLVTLLMGFVLVPRMLKSFLRRGYDDEVTLLTILGVCFFVSYIAYKCEFSLALGAFLVGIIGSTSETRHKLIRFVEPLKAMFAAVFFVSVGLLFDPAACLDHWGKILVLVLVVVFGKTLNCTIGALLAGEEIKTSVQMGFSLAQTGEFAFMVALLYYTLTGDDTTPMYPVAVAVSLITSFLNPLMIRISDPFGAWLDRRCPSRLGSWLRSYRALMMRFRANAGQESPEMKDVRSGVAVVGAIAVLNVAAAAVCSMLNSRTWGTGFFNAHKDFFFSLAFNLFMVAGLAPAFRAAGSVGDALARVLVGDGEAAWLQPLRGAVRLFSFVMLVVLWFIQLTMVAVNLHPQEAWANWALLFIMIGAAAFGWRFFLKHAQRAGQRLAEAMDADMRFRNITHEVPDNPLVLTVPAERVHRIEVPYESPAIGMSIAQLGVRAKTGATVIRVNREGKLHRNTGPDWVFQAGDLIIAYGEGPQIAALKDLLGVTS